MKLGLLGGNTKAKILDLRRECVTMLRLLDFAEHYVTSNIGRSSSSAIIADSLKEFSGVEKGAQKTAV